MSADYAWEKTLLAVRTLAADVEPLRERLANAYNDHLRPLRVCPIPWPDLDRRFDDLCEDVAPAGSDPKQALAAWSDDDVRRLAEAVVSLFAAIAIRSKP